MFKRPITFEDFDGNQVTEVHYFNLSEVELMEIDVDADGGLEKTLQKIVETNDNRQILGYIQKIILKAYGERSADGKRFAKSQELSTNFSQTAAYPALFMELLEDPSKAADFVNGIVPEKIKNMRPQDKPVGPPPGLSHVPPTS